MKIKKFEDWNIAAGGLIAIFFLLLGLYIGMTYKGNEIKNDFVTCGLGAVCPSTHSSEYIGGECIKCTFDDGKKEFNFSLADICSGYKENIVDRFENLKDTTVKTQGENCSNISWQECLYNKGEGIKFETYTTLVYGNDSKDMYCYTIPSPSKCDYIELKNGTLIPKGSCIMTFNYIMKCINQSEIKGIITK